MLNFSAIQNAAEVASKAVLRKCGDVHQVSLYSNSGIKWRTAGFYTKIDDEIRFVFEVFLQEQPEVCILRVFQENPLKIYFARKISQEASLQKAVAQAECAFISLLPTEPAHQPDSNGSLDDLPISEEERELLKMFLSQFLRRLI